MPGCWTSAGGPTLRWTRPSSAGWAHSPGMPSPRTSRPGARPGSHAASPSGDARAACSDWTRARGTSWSRWPSTARRRSRWTSTARARWRSAASPASGARSPAARSASPREPRRRSPAPAWGASSSRPSVRHSTASSAPCPTSIPARHRHELALLQLTRMLFLYFVQAKGWLDGDRALSSPARRRLPLPPARRSTGTSSCHSSSARSTSRSPGDGARPARSAGSRS